MSKENAMAAHSSAHVKSMGRDLGTLFHALEAQYIVARTQWEDVRTLFGHSQERIDLLLKASGLFFFNWQEVFWDRALLQISAMTSSASSKEVTIRQLPKLVHAKITANVQSAVDAAVATAAFTENPRNKWIAHREKNLMLDPNAPQFALGSRKQVTEAFDKILDALNVIHRHSYNGMALHVDAPNPQSGERLVEVLQQWSDWYPKMTGPTREP
jgi:hypothetical protein